MDNFKNNANKLLYDFDLLNELNNYGTPFVVGSYAVDLMAWNDLDIYVSNESILLYIKLGFKIQKTDTFSHYENQYKKSHKNIRKTAF